MLETGSWWIQDHRLVRLYQKLLRAITGCNIAPEDIVSIAHVLSNILTGKRTAEVCVSLTLAKFAD